MKSKILFIFICFLLFSGCHTPKKIASNTTENIQTSEKQSEASATEIYSFVDTTKKSGVEINYFKVEFYPPEDKSDAIPDNFIFPEDMAKLPNSQKGSIKSIEGYTVKANSEESGVNENKENTAISRNAEKNENINRQMEIKEQPAADPYRWRYIFGILIIVVFSGIGLYLLLKKYHILK